MDERKTFVITIDGAEVTPERVSVGDLARILLDLEKGLRATVETNSEIVLLGPFLSLIGIDAGSERLTLLAQRWAMPAVALISSAISMRDVGSLPPGTQEALNSISRVVVDKGWSLSFEPDESIGIRSAVISADEPIGVDEVVKIRGTTTLVGKCIRVGGERPRVRIQFPGGKKFSLDVSEGLARELAKRLYDSISVEGEATWRGDTWELLEFRATRVLAYRPGSVVQAFGKLAELSAGRFEQIDADDYVRQLRYEEVSEPVSEG